MIAAAKIALPISHLSSCLVLAWSGGAVDGGLTDHLTLRPGCPSPLVGARGLGLPAPISNEVRAERSGGIQVRLGQRSSQAADNLRTMKLTK
ncbi:hypothetical protein BKA60DRAFT_631573 [Fusarium oxysporum]|nr:hypothetical protein BKA60DRAFT_631573 [Fusarium oxysporum]